METTGIIKDRKGLIIFLGAVEIFFGIIFLLVFLLTLISVLFIANANVEGRPPFDPAATISASLIYLVFSGVSIVLGIGSIGIKRWARTLSLLLSWGALIVGIITILFMARFYTDMIEMASHTQNYNPAIMAIVKVLMFGFAFIFMILIPGLFILAYRSRNVVYTFQHYDPRERWTDKCPIPVLGMSSIFLYIGILPIYYLAYGLVLPFFGIYVTGFLALVLCIINAALCFYIGIQLYKLNPKAWIYSISLYSFWIASFIITMMFKDLLELYRLMNFRSDQLAMLQGFGFFTSENMIIYTCVISLPTYAFFWFIKKYFNKPGYQQSSAQI